ncbi:MAG: HEAT repeat domain-containing protein [Arenimonas sp.]
MRVFMIALLLLSNLARAEAELPPLSALDKARTQLHEALEDSNPDTRKQAVQALGLIGPRQPYLGQLIDMAKDKDVEVRIAAISSMVDIKSPAVIIPLRNALEDDVPEVSFSAAKALWVLNDPAGREALLLVLEGESKMSSNYLSRKSRESLRMFRTPKKLMMFVLRKSVGSVGVPGLGRGVSSLEGMLIDGELTGRAGTALLLSNDNDPRVMEALREGLRDKTWSVRAASAHAIAIQNNISLQADLIPLLDDKKEAVRVRASAAYLRLELIKSEKIKAPKAKRNKT